MKIYFTYFKSLHSLNIIIKLLLFPIFLKLFSIYNEPHEIESSLFTLNLCFYASTWLLHFSHSIFFKFLLHLFIHINIHYSFIHISNQIQISNFKIIHSNFYLSHLNVSFCKFGSIYIFWIFMYLLQTNHYYWINKKMGENKQNFMQSNSK